MFTITAISNSLRMDDGSTGTMHLNALNGSSGVLGCDSTSDFSGSQSAYGGLFGVSLSDNHPYRPLDSGRTFQESCKSTTPSPSCEASDACAKDDDGSPTNQKLLFKKRNRKPPVTRKSLEELGSTLTVPNNFASLRRHSLDLNTKVSSTYAQGISDMSLSLEDIVDLRDDPPEISERTAQEIEDDLEMKRLSITEVNIMTNDGEDSQPKHHHHHHHHHHHQHSHSHNYRKAKRDLVSDTTVGSSDRAVKILEKIRESKKGDNHKSTGSRYKEQEVRTASAAARSHGLQRQKAHRTPPTRWELQ